MPAKVDYILASGDNHTELYDEPTAMRDSLMAHGVPEDRIILDFAGFRTLDSVVRAKEVFGCDSLTIISQADHNARALYLAGINGIEAVAISAPLPGWKMGTHPLGVARMARTRQDDARHMVW